MGLFGKSPEVNPKDKVNEWCSKLRKENSQLDRQIRGIQREEEKVKRSMKEAAKKGDRDVCIILAKEIIHSRKAISKIYTSKAHINSISMQMKNQLATLRIAGALQRSTEVMKAMQQLIKIPEVAATMRDLSKEMMKAGIIEEMLEDTLEGLEDTDELEEAAQQEVDKVLWEITAGQLGKAPAAVTDSLPVPESVADDEEDLEEMQSRLQALKS
ncbi:charged multivesicular body protein 3-like isoform X2 [Daphnia pulex]|uniref:EOG090X0EF4 n=2 Tax=Daphnia TaxID=6668 RepID=A0A4Y7MUJ3_DAPPU|nr:charged multivesicular body protein 3-like isoform X2 [Daphnia pulex]XP_046650340.1 charged multivesicular body protein 3-like [Daphnia pulicaria]SVE83929.1 EOG090X0EF4 [Daphnia pulex]SVE84534.1 EOG090X0EF4 [Daphnia pulex]SVE85784.1 EOG090X0EF4 [Daphnia pulicaria]